MQYAFQKRDEAIPLAPSVIHASQEARQLATFFESKKNPQPFSDCGFLSKIDNNLIFWLAEKVTRNENTGALIG